MGSSEDMPYRNKKSLGQMLYPNDPVAASLYDRSPVADPATMPRDYGRLDDVLWNVGQLLSCVAWGLLPGVAALIAYTLISGMPIYDQIELLLSWYPRH